MIDSSEQKSTSIRVTTVEYFRFHILRYETCAITVEIRGLLAYCTGVPRKMGRERINNYLTVGINKFVVIFVLGLLEKRLCTNLHKGF